MFEEFFERYKNYSNVELLKIIKQPNDYQPEALKAATQIISLRAVTEEDEKEAESYFEAIRLQQEIRKEKIASFNHKVKDFFEPVLHPNSSIKARKWLNIFLLLVALEYVWTLYDNIEYFVIFFRCVGCEFGILEYGHLITLLYVPLIFYLLYKRKRWGWILLFADNLSSAVMSAEELYQSFKYPHFFSNDSPVDFIWRLVISIAFIIFLWKEDIAAHFNVGPLRKRKFAVRIVIVITVLMGVFSWIVF
jgi:hypothetical protein